MVALKVEKLGDRLAVVLDDDALAVLNVKEGDTVRLEAAAGPANSSWVEDPHARGRAFLRRYNKNLAQLES